MLRNRHIQQTIWQNNNLFFNPKDQGLMYNKFGFIVGSDESNTYGYPNLGHPSNHFNITPFEAIYCDNQTYEHIKMQATIEDNLDLDEIFLVHTRNFVVNEIESDMVYLQNKIIGKNHSQNEPSYKYRAWYKAYTRIEIGNLVTPKTDPGDYVIEATGDITVYAGESVVLKPGFHAQNGSTFHAFIKRDCVQPPLNVYGYLPDSDNIDFNSTQLASENETNRDDVKNCVEVDEIILANEPIISDGNSPTLSDNNLPKEPAQELPQQNFVARLEEE